MPAMRESRVIALAGVFQACALVRQLATRGRAEQGAVESTIASVFRIDAADATGVFGSLPEIKLGLETLIGQLDDGARDLALTQMMIGVLRLERKLARRKPMLAHLREGIEAAQRQVDHLGLTHAAIFARLATLYCETLSELRPRVVVHGNPTYLQQAANVEQIRALLLAGVRAAVLWRQVGGGQLRLLLRRREYAMLARGLLARCTLDRA